MQKSRNSDSPRADKGELKTGGKRGLFSCSETIPERGTLSYLHLPAEGERSPLVGRKRPRGRFFPRSTWISRPALRASRCGRAPLGQVAPPDEAAKRTGPNVWPPLPWGLGPACRSSLKESGKGAPEKLQGMRQIQEDDPSPYSRLNIPKTSLQHSGPHQGVL